MAGTKQFTEKEIEQIRIQANNFWEQSTTTMEPFFELVNDCERLWRAQLPQELEDEYRKHRDRASLAPPDVYINMKSLRANLASALFSTKPYPHLSIDGRPNVRGERLIKAEWVLQSMLDLHANGAGFESEADKTIHQALYAGISAVFTQWKTKIAKKPIRDAETQLPLRDNKNRIIFNDEVIAEFAETISLDIRRCRIDPSMETGSEGRIIGYQSIKTMSELQKLNRDERSFYNFDEKELAKQSFSRDKYYEFIRGETDQYGEKGKVNETFGDKIIDERDIRGLFRFDRKDGSFDFKDLVVKVAGQGDFVLGIKENDLPIPGWELMDFPAVDQELSRFFTMGTVEPMMDVWIELFLKRNQSLDRANRYTYDRYIGDKNATQDLPDVLEDVPGIIHRVDLIAAGLDNLDAALKPLNRPFGADESFGQAASLSQEMQKGMGLSDFVQGTDPQRQETATAVAALVSSGKQGIGQLATVLKNTYLAPAWRKQLILWNFFNAHKVNQNVTTDKQIELGLAPGEIDIFFLADVDIQGNVDSASRLRRFIEGLPQMKASPNYDQFEIDRTFLDLLQIPNADRIMKPNEFLLDIIEREDIALVNGIGLFVSPHDDDLAHIQGHNATREELVQGGGNPQMIDQHIQAHTEQLEKKNAGLGNTKEFGGNAGQIISPTSAATGTNAGVGQGLKSGSR